MDIGDIKRALKAKGIKQVRLANELGLTPDQVSKAMHGTRRFTAPEMDVIRRLLGEDQGASIAGMMTTRKIPVIGSVAAGNWREAIQEPLGEIPMPEEGMPNDAVALRVVGDSMDKVIGEGGIVIFTPSDRALYPDRYYVVLNSEGETTFKQFQADPARLVPCSNNPKHKEILIHEGDFQIVGRVEWFAGRPPRTMI